MAYQEIVDYASLGGAAEVVPLPTIVGVPDLAVAYHAAPGQSGWVGVLPDPVLRAVNLSIPPVAARDYTVTARWNHSKVTREFYKATLVIPTGISSFAHGLSEMPDCWYAVEADNLQASRWVVTGVDAGAIYFENFGAPINVAVYAWILHSLNWPTSAALTAVLAPGAGPVNVPHGLGVVPDLILPTPAQPPGGAVPDGRITVLGQDETDIIMENSAGAGANPLICNVFAQRTFSVQK